MLLGPGTGLGHNSVVIMVECQVTYILDCLRKMSEKNCNSMEVKQSSMDNYVTWFKENLQKTVFVSGGCDSWYKEGTDIPWALWPKTVTDFWWHTLYCDSDDYIFK